MSNNAILAGFRRMGIAKEEMTVHGFRAMARTILREKWITVLRLWSSNWRIESPTQWEALTTVPGFLMNEQQ